ncbi:MAG: hypothetical protein KDB74_13460, partial [Flavobacteriales bacterium]|nr:hypothetical protein [Flavobacteriales bacterium]
MPTLRKISIEYDALGRPVKTVNPDGSEQLVVYGKPKSLTNPNDFTPSAWEKYTYDANDNAGRTHSGSTGSYSDHWNTPKSEEIDALGRVIKTVE